MTNNSNKENLNLISNNGYDLDFSAVFTQSFENYKKTALLVGAIVLVLVIGFTVIVGGIAGVFIGIGSYTEFLTGFNPADQSTTAILITFAATVLGAAAYAPLTAGIINIVHLAQINEPQSFSNAFDYYKSAYFKEIFLATCIVTSISGGFSTLINLLKAETIVDSSNVMLTLSGTLVSIIISFFTFLTVPCIIFGNFKAMDAIKASVVIVSKNWFLILILLIVGILFAFLGIFGFCLGIFFTLPFFYSLQYIIYISALPIERNTEIDDIGKTDIV